jgi:hypothetical protein
MSNKSSLLPLGGGLKTKRSYLNRAGEVFATSNRLDRGYFHSILNHIASMQGRKPPARLYDLDGVLYRKTGLADEFQAQLEGRTPSKWTASAVASMQRTWWHQVLAYFARTRYYQRTDLAQLVRDLGQLKSLASPLGHLD